MRTVPYLLAQSTTLFFLVFFSCAGMAAEAKPGPAAKPASVAKPASSSRQAPAVSQTLKPKQPVKSNAKPTLPVKKSTIALQPASQQTTSGSADKIQRDLESFADTAITKMNLRVVPSIGTKEVTKVSEGYRARYIAIDKDSLKTSYSPSEHKVVPYIGRMLYHEVEYVSTGKTKEQALAGPFSEANRSPVTELIKYMRGKWTY